MRLLSRHHGAHSRPQFLAGACWAAADGLSWVRGRLRVILDALCGDEDEWEHGLDDRDIADLFRDECAPGVYLPATLPAERQPTDIIPAVRDLVWVPVAGAWIPGRSAPALDPWVRELLGADSVDEAVADIALKAAVHWCAVCDDFADDCDCEQIIVPGFRR